MRPVWVPPHCRRQLPSPSEVRTAGPRDPVGQSRARAEESKQERSWRDVGLAAVQTGGVVDDRETGHAVIAQR